MRRLDRVRQARLVDGEAVVHRRDLDLAGDEVFHGMVRAVMALLHLHGAAAERDAEHLVAEADAEQRHLLVEHFANHRHGVLAGGGRVARAVGEEHAVGLPRQDVFRGRRRRQHREPAAGLGEQPQDVALGAVVDGDDMIFRRRLAAEAHAPFPRRLVPAVGLRLGDFLGEVHALESRPGRRLGRQAPRGRRHRRDRSRSPHSAYQSCE